MTESTANRDFGVVLLEAIDEALLALGESVKTSIYFKLNNTFNIKKQEIPEKVDVLSDALEQVFGLGARHLEIMFMKCLYTKMGPVCELYVREWISLEMTFKEYVHLMRQIYEKTKNREIEIFTNQQEIQARYDSR